MKFCLGNSLTFCGYQHLGLDEKGSIEYDSVIKDMNQWGNYVASEVVVDGVLESFEWPDAFFVISEMVRLLKIGGHLLFNVYDLKKISELIVLENESWVLTGIMYGYGKEGKCDTPKNRFCYTHEMLRVMLLFLGCREMRVSSGDKLMADISCSMKKLGADDMSMTLCFEKYMDPMVDVNATYSELMSNNMAEFEQCAVRHCLQEKKNELAEMLKSEGVLVQKLSFELIETRQRIAYLEERIASLREKNKKV